MNNELQFLIFNTPQFNANINVVVKDETIWLTQKAMAELFDVKVPAISKHLKKVFEEGELDEQVVISKMETTTPHGAKAEREYDQFNKTQKIVSDFDKQIKKLTQKEKKNE